MIRTLLATLLVTTAAPALAQVRDFRIGGEAYAESEILDARALPDLGGRPNVMITLSEEGAKRLASSTQRLVGKPMPIALDGKTLMDPIVREPILGGEVMISGLALTLNEATALAKRISGKDPLPDSLEE